MTNVAFPRGRGFAVLAGLFLRRVLSHRPYVAITAEGLYDNGSGIWSGIAWIEWDEVANLSVPPEESAHEMRSKRQAAMERIRES